MEKKTDETRTHAHFQKNIYYFVWLYLFIFCFFYTKTSLLKLIYSINIYFTFKSI